MNKKIAVIIAECIPIISAFLSITLILCPLNAKWMTPIIYTTMLLGFLGFVFFFLGCKFIKDDKITKLLGILDIAATLSIVLLYIIAIFSFGL